MIELHEIIGQDSAVSRLQLNMTADRMPHAFLFAGPIGVGRRTTATALAKILLCENPQAGEGGLFAPAEDTPKERRACRACGSCRMMENDSHPDFQLIYKELARFHDDAQVRSRVMQGLGIDVIRSFLIAPASRAATRGRGKVFIIQEAELMNIAAQNSLLKTLEEPPADVTIILLCQKPDQLLATTRSRCSLVRFGPLPRDFVSTKLAEGKIDPQEAAFWSAFTGGSIGRAMQLASAGMYEIKRKVLDDLALLNPAGDAKLGETFAKMTDKLAENAVHDAKKKDDANLSKNLATRRATGATLEIIASAFSDALAVATNTSRPLVNSDQPQIIEALAEKFQPTEIAEILEQLSRYERLLWRNLNAKIVWDNVVITCASAAVLEV